ncbi:ribosome hibernation-promoting factor, HPF/YfiA family [Patescibacteria group bacterium]
MPTTITGKNIDLTEPIKAYINEKTDLLFTHFDNIIGIDVEVCKNKRQNKGEVFHVRMNVSVPNKLLHAEETQDDLYAAIDLCRDDVDRQLRRYKEKFETKKRKAGKQQRNLKSILTFWKK